MQKTHPWHVCIDVQRFRSRKPFSSKLIFQKGHDLADFSFYTFVSQTQVRHYPWKSSTNSEDTIWIDHSRWSLVLLGECDRVIQMSDHERLLLPQGSGHHYYSNPKKDSQQESTKTSTYPKVRTSLSNIQCFTLDLLTSNIKCVNQVQKHHHSPKHESIVSTYCVYAVCLSNIKCIVDPAPNTKTSPKHQTQKCNLKKF